MRLNNPFQFQAKSKFLDNFTGQPFNLDQVSFYYNPYLTTPLIPATTPWYAPITAHRGSQPLEEIAPGKNRHQALDNRLRRLFNLAGLSYKSAHKVRHGHAVYGLQYA